MSAYLQLRNLLFYVDEYSSESNHLQSLFLLKVFGFFQVLESHLHRAGDSASISLPPCHLAAPWIQLPSELLMTAKERTRSGGLELFFLLGLFFLGRTDLSTKGTLLFFKSWFVACFLGSELTTDGLAFEAEYAALQPRGRTSALTRWCVFSVVLGAGYVTGGENAAEVIPHAYLWDFSRS